MMLSDGVMAVPLPDSMIKEVQYWQPVAQAQTFTLRGALILDESEKQAGEPITYRCVKDGYAAWVRRKEVDKLHRMASKKGQELTLTRYGVETKVTFRHTDGPAVEAESLVDYEQLEDPEEWMLLTLRLITI